MTGEIVIFSIQRLQADRFLESIENDAALSATHKAGADTNATSLGVKDMHK